jgi:hypothetical protein
MLLWDRVLMRGNRTAYGLIALIPVVVLGAFLLVWFLPAGPSISGGSSGTSVGAGYVGNHYSAWTVFKVRHSFVAERIEVVTNSAACRGTIRLVGKPVEGGPLAGVSAGALPGASVIGRRLTPQLGQQLALVLTPYQTGRCQATTIRFASHSWGRTRWTTLDADFVVNVTHRTGQDTRSKEAHPPAL